MSNKATRLVGVSSLISRINKLEKSFQDEMKAIVEDVADKIENKAQTLAPDRRANMEVAISQNIGKYPLKGGNAWRIEVNSQALPFAAYAEFGTGQDAASYLPSLPEPWRKLAWTFYVNGKGTLRHTPFLYPAYFEHSPELLKELKLLIKKSKI